MRNRRARTKKNQRGDPRGMKAAALEWPELILNPDLELRGRYSDGS
jgi:hypothetical protein